MLLWMWTVFDWVWDVKEWILKAIVKCPIKRKLEFDSQPNSNHIQTFFIYLVFKYKGRCVFIALVERITSRRETIWLHSTFLFYFSVAPQIRPVPHNGHLVVYQGDSATLSCDILKGNPTPEITWKRKVRNRKTFFFFILHPLVNTFLSYWAGGQPYCRVFFSV